MTAVLIGGAMAMTAPAQTLTAEQALENYRDTFVPVSELDCPESENPDEIVVCGRRPGAPDPNRRPLPVEPLRGARDSDGALSGTQVLHTQEPSSTVGPNTGCGGAHPAFQAVGVGMKAVQALEDAE